MIDNKGLTIYYDNQCPYINQTIDNIKEYCMNNNIPITINLIDSLEKAKEVPAPFNNFCIFYKGILQTVNLLTIDQIKNILEK